MTQPKMNSGFLDLSLVFAMGQYEISIITDKALKAKGIVPNTWQLAQPATTSRHQVDLLFKNGVRITGQPGAIRFVESLVNKTSEDLLIPQLAQTFATTLPQLNYRGLGINPRFYAAFPDAENGAQQFFNERLFTPNAWQSFGKAAVRPSVDFGFTLDHCLLRVNIQDARLALQDQGTVSAILFMGNYHYGIQAETAEDRLAYLNKVMGNVSHDLAIYQDLIDNQFLAQEQRSETSEEAVQPVAPASKGSKFALAHMFKKVAPQPSGA